MPPIFSVSSRCHRVERSNKSKGQSIRWVGCSSAAATLLSGTLLASVTRSIEAKTRESRRVFYAVVVFVAGQQVCRMVVAYFAASSRRVGRFHRLTR